MNSTFGLIVFSTSIVLAITLASIIEYAMHRTIFTTIAGAIGGWSGQRLGRSLSGMLLENHDEWLSDRKFEQVYRMHYAYSYAIQLVAVVCGLAIGFSINYYFLNKQTKSPTDNEYQQSSNS